MKRIVIIGVIVWLFVVLVGCVNDTNTTTSDTNTVISSSNVSSNTTEIKTTTISSTVTTKTTANTNASVTVTSYYDVYTNPDYPIDSSKIESIVPTTINTRIKDGTATVEVNLLTYYKDLTEEEYMHLQYPHYYDPSVCFCFWY